MVLVTLQRSSGGPWTTKGLAAKRDVSAVLEHLREVVAGFHAVELAATSSTGTAHFFGIRASVTDKPGTRRFGSTRREAGALFVSA